MEKNNPISLINILQKVQNEYGYISEDTIRQISKRFNISPSKIFSVASFYSQFKFTKPPKYSIKVCLGTACHVRGGDEIFNELKRDLSINKDNVTSDYKFGLEHVACFGCCALGPVLVINNKVYGRMTSQKAKKVIMKL